MPFSKKLKARRAKEQNAKRRRAFLEECVRTHLVPAFIEQGFRVALPRTSPEATDPKSAGSFPSWGRFIRDRGSLLDKAEIQFSTYGRAAFRINACAIPKNGMMTAGGHRTAQEIDAGGLHDHFETHARPWLRPALKALRVEPLGAWFSVWHWPFLSPAQSEYEKLALRVAALVPEIDLALREDKLGPHLRRLKFSPFPPEVLERIEKLRSQRAKET
jgi:hypothetical protein